MMRMISNRMTMKRRKMRRRMVIYIMSSNEEKSLYSETWKRRPPLGPKICGLRWQVVFTFRLLNWNMKGLSWPSVVFVGQRSLFPGVFVSRFHCIIIYYSHFLSRHHSFKLFVRLFQTHNGEHDTRDEEHGPDAGQQEQPTHGERMGPHHTTRALRPVAQDASVHGRTHFEVGGWGTEWAYTHRLL